MSLTRSYDQDYRLAGQTVGNVQNLLYSYEANGNLQTANDQLTPANSQRFSFDPLNRLTAATGANNLVYSYDATGNRTADYTNTAETRYNYDTNSQKLLSQTGAHADSIQTDATGNITQSQGNNYLYDNDQRLAGVSNNLLPIATYGYDTQGRRLVKTVYTAPVAITTHFDYDLQSRLLNENGPSLAANYVYLDGEPLARVDYDLSDTTGNVASWNIAYYHNNQLGAPLKTTDSSGNISWIGQYDPFGNVQIINQSITQNLRYPGQYFDQESGLIYNNQRYLNALRGWYDQSDRIGLAGGINSYAYVGNNPLRFIDPTGKFFFVPLLGYTAINALADLISIGVLSQVISNGFDTEHVGTNP